MALKILNDERMRASLRDIFMAGVRAVDPYRLVNERLSLRGGRTLTVDLGRAAGSRPLRFDLDRFRRVYVVGAGKATAPMARAVEELLGERIHAGAVAVKYGHTDRLERIELLEAGHPVPDDNSAAAARRMLELADQAGDGDLVITLLSGGGSALLAAPLSLPAAHRLRLEHIQAATQVLLRSGATIEEVNCVRKHLSGIKGGRLAARIHPARALTLILSDVVGDRLDSIASGPLVFDGTTYEQAMEVLARYGIEAEVPDAVLSVLRAGLRGDIPETPKQGDPATAGVRTVVLGGTLTALRAAAEHARKLGYTTVALSAQITGEARETARFYAGVGKEQVRSRLLGSPPLCVLGGGETTVTVRGTGRGGRNQEMALAFLIEFLREQRENAGRGIGFLAASTDGNDGPTDAAGALVLPGRDRPDLAEARRSLRDNDSYSFFRAHGGLFMTGPTNTNVCDLHVLTVG